MTQIKMIEANYEEHLEKMVNDFLKEFSSNIESVQDIKFIDKFIDNTVSFKAIIIYNAMNK